MIKLKITHNAWRKEREFIRRIVSTKVKPSLNLLFGQQWNLDISETESVICETDLKSLVYSLETSEASI